VGEFGKKFRKARESKQLSLDSVSNVTKISARMLQAIEEEKFDLLPGGVFNKGFIRAYAKHLGLDPEDAITEYLDCLRQEQVDSHDGWDSNGRSDARAAAKSAVAAPAKPPANAPPVAGGEELPHLHLPRAEHIRPARKEYLGRPSPGIPWTLIYLVAIIVIAIAILWIRHSRAVHSASTKSSAAAMTAAPPVQVNAQSPSSAPPSSATIAAVTSPPRSSAAPKTETARAPAAGAATSATSDTNQVKVEKKDDVTIRSYGASTPATAEASAANLTLIIRATENSWISVTSDGQVVTQETLIAPAHPKFRAARELVVRVGNAAGISFVWNGEELAPQGAEAEAKTLVFDAQGMRALAADQVPH